MKKNETFPIVGIGASAGGLAAFEAFFSGMPGINDVDMAFILVQHLAPDYKSLLTELIGRCTRMKVVEVQDGMKVQPNLVYIIPPDHDMALHSGCLRLLKPEKSRGQRMPIDFFFHSLAQELSEQAIGVILSGTGSDGALGVRAIKGAGGMVMVQKPESCEHDGMPCSALATGLVDYTLPPVAMAAQIIDYTTHPQIKKMHSLPLEVLEGKDEMKKILDILHIRTSHDFSHYKKDTIVRRIERRLAVHNIKKMDAYALFLQNNPAEVEALFSDLLIGVTNFFRDPKAFKVLEQKAIPKIFALGEQSIRVWVPGCSTGEEAYSIAILLREKMEDLKRNIAIQVFASDIDKRALGVGRAGVYPASIAKDISPARLARFFRLEPDGSSYRILKVIRDIVIFSEQNLIKDPPFSKLNLISCRNLLIYMNAQVQKKIMPMFHYALVSNGLLFLGSSESVGGFDDLYVTLGRQAKLYQRQYKASESKKLGKYPLPTLKLGKISGLSSRKIFENKLNPRDLTERAMLEQSSQVGVLINSQGDITYLHGRSGKYLEPCPGESGTYNILKMAREGLRRDLEMTLHKAVKIRGPVHITGVRVKTNGDFTTIKLTVSPVADDDFATEKNLFLVVLEEMPEEAPKLQSAKAISKGHIPQQLAQLTLELQAKESYIKLINEEFQNTSEELKSSNEEMQSINEELQSTNEELETSKEELQSVNEELLAINNELQSKIIDLSQVNDDMNNL
ncbi:MAG: chemotaxis protein CheB, partial [Pseudomonadota bacterium]